MRDITLINPATSDYKTFWKRGGQCMVTEGTVHGLTYSVKQNRPVEKADGNAEYTECKRAGFQDWESFCRAKDIMCIFYDFGSVLN